MTETEIRAEMGRAGGLARAKGMSKRERRASAIKAAIARWSGQGFPKGNSHQRRKQKRAKRAVAKKAAERQNGVGQ